MYLGWDLLDHHFNKKKPNSQNHIDLEILPFKNRNKTQSTKNENLRTWFDLSNLVLWRLCTAWNEALVDLYDFSKQHRILAK